mgnify:CR=1 FL=1
MHEQMTAKSLHGGKPGEQRPRTTRRWFFWGWIALTIVAAVYIGVAAPFAEASITRIPLIGAVFVPLMILLLGAGIAWLIVFVSRRGPPTNRA